MEQGPARKPALPTVSFAAAGAAAVSLAVVAVPWLRMSVEAPSLRVALETGGSLLAVTTVVLWLRQCGLRSRADHLWLTAGLVVLAATALAVAGLIVAGAWSSRPRALRDGRQPRRHADARDRRLRARRASCEYSRARYYSARARSASWSLARRAARRRRPALRAPNAAGRPRPSRPRIVQLATAAALVAAAVGLARRRQEPLLRWVAVAVVLGRLRQARLRALPAARRRRTSTSATSCASPPGSRSSSACSTRCAAASASAAQAAVERERRRLARELHDGVAQELAFIRRRAGRLAETPDGVEIVDAADRALEDSRRAIEALVPPAHEPLEVALERLGARLATECGVEVQVNVRDRHRDHRRRPRRARPDHLRGRPQRRPPRRRPPRARGPRRARRWPCASSTTAAASATAPTAASASPATA